MPGRNEAEKLVPPTDSRVCPHCNNVCECEPAGALRWRCAICGGARVPGVDGAALGPEGVSALVRARREHAASIALTVASWGLGITAAAGITLAGVLWLFSHGVGLALGAFMIALAVAAMASSRVAKSSKEHGKRALEEAWGRAAEVYARRAGDITAIELAKAMHLTETDAEDILEKLSAENRARVDVGEDADLHYRVGDPESLRGARRGGAT